MKRPDYGNVFLDSYEYLLKHLDRYILHHPQV